MAATLLTAARTSLSTSLVLLAWMCVPSLFSTNLWCACPRRRRAAHGAPRVASCTNSGCAWRGGHGPALTCSCPSLLVALAERPRATPHPTPAQRRAWAAAPRWPLGGPGSPRRNSFQYFVSFSRVRVAWSPTYLPPGSVFHVLFC